MPMYVKIPKNLSHLQISHFRGAEVDCACVFIIDVALYYANVQLQSVQFAVASPKVRRNMQLQLTMLAFPPSPML